MRLLLDLQCVQSSSSARGIGRYALALAQALYTTAGEHQVEVLLNAGDDAERLLRARHALECFLPAGSVHVFEAPWPWLHRPSEERRLVAEALRTAAIASLEPDAVLVGSIFEGDGENVLSVPPLGQGPPTAAVLYDLIPALEPETYLLGPGAKDYWRRMEHLRRCDRLLAISEHSAGQARTHLGNDSPPTAAIWGGPYAGGVFPDHDPRLLESELAALPTRYLLSVGGDHPRKNLDRLVAAWGRVAPSERSGAALVIACRLNVGTVRRLHRLAKRAGLTHDELVLTGEVSDAALTRLYEQTLAFVFPSTEEGLGMPPLEAMALGSPTVMAQGSSLSELADSDEAFFDGRDVADIARALRGVLTDSALRDRLRAVAGRSAQTFTWARAATLAWAELELMANGRSWIPAPATSSASVHSLSPASLATLAPCTPVPVSDTAAAARLVALGAVELPLLLESGPAASVRHDPYATSAAALAGLNLSPALSEEVVRALGAPPRWWLERPAPVCLVLTASPPVTDLEQVGLAVGLLVRQAGSEMAHLAQSVDVVVVANGVLAAELLPLLHRARRHGAVVLEVVEPGGSATLPFAAPSRLTGPAECASSWVTALSAAALHGRTTGWPWRSE